ncbi:MAG: MGMT family protein [Haloferacaceae archaeon]
MESGIYARESSALGRAVQFGLASGRVISVSFPDEVPADAGTDHPLLDRVFDYLDGAEDDFDDVDVALTVPTDRRQVLESVAAIPYGRTVAVPQLVRLAGLDDEDEADVATVEAALRENPVPLFVPDHRVDGPGATPPDVASTLRDVEGS